MDVKETLINILNALTQVETKGQGTLIMADCITTLNQVINQIPNEVQESKSETEVEEDK